MRRVPLVAIAALAALAGACAGRGEPPEPSAPASAPPAATAAATATAPAADLARRPPVRVVVIGDSLAAGMGLPASEAFPAVLERRLAERGLAARVQNAGVSGDTTAGGLERLDWLLSQRPDVVVLELGANDGLRGFPLDRTEDNLRSLVARSRAAGARVLLVGMKVPANMGRPYADGFEAAFRRVSEDTGVPLVPFLLEGVALVPEANQADGIHPTAQGQERLADNVLPHLEPLVREASGKGVGTPF